MAFTLHTSFSGGLGSPRPSSREVLHRSSGLPGSVRDDIHGALTYRGFGNDPMQASRHMRSYGQEPLAMSDNKGHLRTMLNNNDDLYTPRSRTFIYNQYRQGGPRRTVSWSHVPRDRSSSGWPSRATTPRSLPGIPWGQVPGVSGTRTGTISPIDSEGCTSPTSMLPKGYDYLKRARLITKVLFKEASRIHQRFALCFSFNLFDSPQRGEEIRQRLGTVDVFDVTLVLRPPVPSEAFEIVSTLPRDVPPGHAVARLNPSLTPAEKVAVRRVWGPLLLGEEYLTPSLVHQCIADGIRKAITSLDKVAIGRDLYSIILTSSPPELSLVVSYINLDICDDDSSSSFTINIVPVIIAAGVPRISGFKLRMPTPHVLPYSRVGLAVMRDFDKEVNDWSLFWKLEGRAAALSIKSKQRSETNSIVPLATKRAQRKQEEQERLQSRPLPLQTHLRAWVISFEPLEQRLLELCLQRDFFTHAREAFELFDDMVNDFGEEWQVFPPALATSMKLWTIYRTATKNSSVMEWLLALLTTIYDCLQKRFGAYFLLPRINMLASIEKKHVNSLRKQLQPLLENQTKKTKTVPDCRKYCVKAKIRRSKTIGV